MSRAHSQPNIFIILNFKECAGTKLRGMLGFNLQHACRSRQHLLEGRHFSAGGEVPLFLLMEGRRSAGGGAPLFYWRRGGAWRLPAGGGKTLWGAAFLLV